MSNKRAVGAGEGAISGAAAGASVGGPWGAAIGGVAGGVFGYMGSDEEGYSLPWDQYNARLAQISDYSSKLEGATNQYATAVSNMYNTAFTQYLPKAEAAFAGRGLQIDSGAFASELAKTSADLTSRGLVDVAKQRIGNVSSVESQYGNAWDAMFGASVGSNKAGFDNANANMAGLGQAAVGIGKLGLMGYNGKQPNGTPPTRDFYSNTGGTTSNYGLGPSWNGGNPFAGDN